MKGMKPLGPPRKKMRVETTEQEVIEEKEEVPPKVQEGEGKIISSREVIHGSKTNFDKVLAAGDVLIAEIDGSAE